MYSKILVAKLAERYSVRFGTVMVAGSNPTSSATYLVSIFHGLYGSTSCCKSD